VVGVDLPDTVRRPGDVDAPRRTEVEQHGAGVVKQLEDPLRAAGHGQVEIRHAAPQQWVPLAEVVGHVEPGQEPRELGAWPLEAQQLGDRVAHRLGSRVASLEEGLRHHISHDSGRGRVALRVVGVQEGLG